jgi:hypothetical protein
MTPDRHLPQWRAMSPFATQKHLFRTSFDGSLSSFGSQRIIMIPHDFRRIALAHELLTRPAPTPSPENPQHEPRDTSREISEEEAGPGIAAIPAEHELVG